MTYLGDLAAAIVEADDWDRLDRSIDVVRPEFRNRAWWIIGRDDEANHERWHAARTAETPHSEGCSENVREPDPPDVELDL